jgi:hypothetical protein
MHEVTDVEDNAAANIVYVQSHSCGHHIHCVNFVYFLLLFYDFSYGENGLRFLYPCRLLTVRTLKFVYNINYDYSTVY